jgi:hypothetical protein
MDADTNKTTKENGSVPPSSSGQLDHEVRHTCPSCFGTGQILGMFPVYAESVPQEKRKPFIKLKCDLCNGTGLMDEGYPLRKQKGEQSRRLRMNNNYGLRDVSKRFGVNPSIISSFERGKKLTDSEMVELQQWLAALEGK